MHGDFFLTRKIKNLLPLKTFLKLQYYATTGKKLHLSNPVTYNEKIQWLKVNYHLKVLPDLIDKFEVREYIKRKIGAQYLNELYGVFEDPREIKLNELPDCFVLKGTHGSGMILFCRNNKSFNWEMALAEMEKWLKIDWYSYGREWAYKDLKPRIICEKLLMGENGDIPDDYKVVCFNGEPKAIQVNRERYKSVNKLSWYDIEWNKLEMTHKIPFTTFDCQKPKKLDELLEVSRTLAKEFVFVRVDFYEVKDKLVFGELTFYPGRGLDMLWPEKYERLFGDYLILPQ